MLANDKETYAKVHPSTEGGKEGLIEEGHVRYEKWLIPTSGSSFEEIELT